MAYEGVQEQFGVTARSIGVVARVGKTPSGKGVELGGGVEIRQETDEE